MVDFGVGLEASGTNQPALSVLCFPEQLEAELQKL
jgi:hypothetical protein